MELQNCLQIAWNDKFKVSQSVREIVSSKELKVTDLKLLTILCQCQHGRLICNDTTTTY